MGKQTKVWGLLGRIRSAGCACFPAGRRRSRDGRRGPSAQRSSAASQRSARPCSQDRAPASPLPDVTPDPPAVSAPMRSQPCIAGRWADIRSSINSNQPEPRSAVPPHTAPDNSHKPKSHAPIIALVWCGTCGVVMFTPSLVVAFLRPAWLPRPLLPCTTHPYPLAWLGIKTLMLSASPRRWLGGQA